MSGGRNLIMGLWAGGGFPPLEKFVGSLRRTGFDGDLCIFVSDVPAQAVAAMMTHGIIVERADRLATPPMHFQSSRYFNYLEFLTRHAGRYANVMISDLRDAVFQADPFAQPLPAEIVFALEPCLIGKDAINRNWIAMAYDDAVADNLTEFMISCSGTTFGTTAGMLRYLTAMTTELAGLAVRGVLETRGLDQGIHNYLIRMRPLRDAWCDTGDSLVSTMGFVPDEAIELTPGGVLVHGRRVPVLHQWDRSRVTRPYVMEAPQFRLAPAQRIERSAPVPAVAAAERGREAVLAYYHRPRDADWLAPFLGSLRCSGFAGDLYCVGVFNDEELALLARHGCSACRIDAPDTSLDVENVAHLYLHGALNRLAETEQTRPDHVLLLDSVRATFLRDPFQGATIGLSLFHEGGTLIGRSEFNLQRFAMFAPAEGDVLQLPVVSSSVLRGRLDVVQDFYRRLLLEFTGRAELLRIAKAIQGAVNKLCHGDAAGAPVIQHANGGEVYFEIWGEGLPVDLGPPIRVAGTVPFAVLNPVRETELTRAVRASHQL